MPDCSFGDLGCYAVGGVRSLLDNVARSAAEGAATILGHSFSFWVRTPTVDPDTAVVRDLQQLTIPVAGLILACSVLVQALWMVVSRKKDPAINIAVGLVRYTVVTSIGLVLLAAALRAGDDLSTWLVDQGLGDFAARMSTLTYAFENAFLMIVVAVFGLILGLIQWLLAFFRQAGLLVLAVVLPLMASGSLNDSTKVWLNRGLPWIIALAAYKPMAAMIYTVGFTFIGEGQDLATVLTGLMVMVLAIIAMPAMLRFFSWSQVAATGGIGVGGVIAAGAIGATSVAALRSARAMQMTGPGSATPGADRSQPPPALPPGRSEPPALPPGGSGQGGGPGSGGGGTGGGGGTPSGKRPDGSGSTGGGPTGGGGGGTTGPSGGGPTSSPSGAGNAPDAGVPAARSGGGAPASRGGTPGPAAGGSSSGAGGSGGGAAAGAAGAAGAAAARGAKRAGEDAADGFTRDAGEQDGEQRR